MGAQLRDVEIDRRLRGRSEIEAELGRRRGRVAPNSSRRSVCRTSRSAEDLLAREEAHVAQIDRLAAQLEGLVGKEPPETLPPTRDAAALEIEQKTQRARGARADRQGAARPRAPRGRGPRPGDRARARPRRRGQRPRPGRGEPVDAEAGRRPGRAARQLAASSSPRSSVASASTPRRSRRSIGPSRRR